MKTAPLTYEAEWWAQGVTRIAGLDEAGRGPWAGPVVAAAVILPAQRPDLPSLLDGVRDSKECSPEQREALFPVVWRVAVAAGIGAASPREVEELNVVGATRLAMMRALACLRVAPDALLIDGKRLRLDTPLPQQSLLAGDRHSLSVAAASILAKVSRDRMMREAHKDYPQYGFGQHKGYGTAQHQAALETCGPCLLHRRTYGPIRALLEGAGP